MGLRSIFNSLFSSEEVEEIQKDADEYVYDDGYGDGYDDGLDDNWDKNKKAISDGLRNGASECGKAMANK